MLDQTSQQPHLAALPPVSSVCAESPSLQRCWTLSYPNLQVLRSPLCHSQNQTAAHPIRRRCLPDTGRQRQLFFVPFAALGLLQRHSMDKPAFQQLQAQLVKRPPVESLRATGGYTLGIHRQVLKGRLRGQRADASTGHADGIPLFQIKGRWRLETVQDMRSSSSNPVSGSETSIKIYGSKEEIQA